MHPNCAKNVGKVLEMYNNYFHLVHALCVIFLAWPQPSPH